MSVGDICEREILDDRAIERVEGTADSKQYVRDDNGNMVPKPMTPPPETNDEGRDVGALVYDVYRGLHHGMRAAIQLRKSDFTPEAAEEFAVIAQRFTDLVRYIEQWKRRHGL